jgi:hypothetical protein
MGPAEGQQVGGRRLFPLADDGGVRRVDAHDAAPENRPRDLLTAGEGFADEGAHVLLWGVPAFVLDDHGAAEQQRPKRLASAAAVLSACE